MHFPSAMLCVAMVLTPFAQGHLAEQWNRKSILTSERPVEVPGIVLPAGSYVVRLQESGGKRSVVQIMNRDETQILATVTAVPDHRLRPDGEVEFTYHHVTGNGPQSVQSWYYSSDLVGLEFVYPKARARELARASNGHVMASNIENGVVVAVTPNGKEIVIDEPLQTARQKPQ